MEELLQILYITSKDQPIHPPVAESTCIHHSLAQAMTKMITMRIKNLRQVDPDFTHPSWVGVAVAADVGCVHQSWAELLREGNSKTLKRIMIMIPMRMKAVASVKFKNGP